MGDRFLRVSDSFQISYMKDTIGNHKQFMHIHSVDELVIVDTGTSTIIADDKLYQAQGAYAIFYPAGQMHQQLNTRSCIYIRHCIKYDRAMTDALPPDIVPRSFFVLPLEEHELAKLRPYLELMIGGSASKEHEITCRYLLAIVLQMLAPLLRIRLNAAAGKQENSKAIQDICNYIGDHFAEPLTLDGIAKHFFISRAKLVRIFRGTLDVSVGEYITNVRISKAKSMLHQGVAVHEAAAFCGYTNVGYFIRIFREHTGLTPADFKRIH